MEYLEFIKEKNNMCKKYYISSSAEPCVNCPFSMFTEETCDELILYHPKVAEGVVKLYLKMFDEKVEKANKPSDYCKCYHIENGDGVCWGTREKDPCPYNGNYHKCIMGKKSNSEV